MRAGAFGTAPVYFYSTSKNLIASWNFADLLKEAVTIDPLIAASMLMLEPVYSHRQLCSGVVLLTERASLYADVAGLHFNYPEATWYAEKTLPHIDPFGVFSSALNEIIQARPLEREYVIAEVSGGVDSATVATAASQHFGPIASTGILLSCEHRNQQTQRRRELIARLSLEDETVDMDNHLPVVDLCSTLDANDHPFREFYLEAFLKIWSRARDRGCRTLMTGIGGDELFPRHADHSATTFPNQDKRVAQLNSKRLLTPRARNAALARRVDDAPASPVSVTSLLSHVCRAPELLRLGIWPINPLSDPRLVWICKGFQSDFRHGRPLMREYMKRIIGIDLFPPNYVKETFEYILLRVISCNSKNIRLQLRNCALADLGLVEPAAVFELLNRVETTRDLNATASFASFFWLERFVRRAVSN